MGQESFERDRVKAQGDQNPSPEQVIFSQPQVVPKKSKREHDEETTPLWVKLFGGSILSIAFLSVITLTGYVVSNLNNLQMQINGISVESLSKKEFNERTKGLWDASKTQNDSLNAVKERVNAIEQLAKERQLWMEKSDAKVAELAKALDQANKDIAAHQERTKNVETQIGQLREENRQLQKDLQALRERTAAIEGKLKKE